MSPAAVAIAANRLVRHSLNQSSSSRSFDSEADDVHHTTTTTTTTSSTSSPLVINSKKLSHQHNHFEHHHQHNHYSGNYHQDYLKKVNHLSSTSSSFEENYQIYGKLISNFTTAHHHHDRHHPIRHQYWSKSSDNKSSTSSTKQYRQTRSWKSKVSQLLFIRQLAFVTLFVLGGIFLTFNYRFSDLGSGGNGNVTKNLYQVRSCQSNQTTSNYLDIFGENIFKLPSVGEQRCLVKNTQPHRFHRHQHVRHYHRRHRHPIDPILSNLTGKLEKYFKLYSLYFLALLILVSFVCEKLFSCQITIHYEDNIVFNGPINKEFIHQEEEEEEEEEIEEDEDEDEDFEWDLYDKNSKAARQDVREKDVPKYTTLGHSDLHFSTKVITTDLKISLIYFLPLRLISRLWGYINQITLPLFARRPLYLWYSRTFGCNLDEIEEQDFTKFKNLSQFFRRTLKPNVRPIGIEDGITSPADGRIVQIEPVSTTGYVGSVKGIHYSVDNFLGPNIYSNDSNQWSMEKYLSNKAKARGNCLYSCVVYLAPGDYHRFHSPVEWTVQHRRHFSGHLLSVKPSFVAKVPNLFAINERVAYFGQWKYGFFSMTAVGATNVGTVNVFCDPELQTNQTYFGSNYRTERNFEQENGGAVHFSKGELFGEFNLGSTIVLVFEAPESFCFTKKIDQKVQYGQTVGHVQL